MRESDCRGGTVCRVGRCVIGEDAGPVPDAPVPDAPGFDTGDAPGLDVGLDAPPNDAFSTDDAFSSDDAFSTDDAFSSDDAGSSDDAATDAFADDAFVEDSGP